MIHRDDINSFVVNINFRLTSAVLVTNKTRQNCRELKSASASQFDLIIESDLFLTQTRELWRQSTNIAAKKNEPWKSDQISLHHAHDIPVHCYVISKTLSSIIRFDADNKSQPALDFKLVPLFFSVSVFSGWQTLPLMLSKNRKRLFFRRERWSHVARIVSKFNGECRLEQSTNDLYDSLRRLFYDPILFLPRCKTQQLFFSSSFSLSAYRT